MTLPTIAQGAPFVWNVLSDINGNNIAANPNGQTTSANSQPVVIASDQSPIPLQQFVQYETQLGNAYMATTGNIATGAANAFVAIQMTGNNISKSILLYSIVIGNGSGLETDGRILTLNAATVDANLTTNLLTSNVGNNMIGGGASSLTTLACSPAGTTQTTGLVGNNFTDWLSTANTMFDVFQGGKFIYAPKLTTWSIEIAQKKTTSTNAAMISIFWLELP